MSLTVGECECIDPENLDFVGIQVRQYKHTRLTPDADEDEVVVSMLDASPPS